MKDRRVYLDYAATTSLDGEVLDEMLPFLKNSFGNPDSLHSYGREAAYAVTSARDCVAEILGMKPKEIYFTSGGTESCNWAVRSLAHGEKSGVVLSDIEHQAVIGAAELCKKTGEEVVFAHTDENGVVSARAVENALTDATRLVCVMAVNNETGCIQPLEEISALCRARGVPLFSDCVQAGNALDLKKICSICDAVSLSGHKLYGPKGTGVLAIKQGVRTEALLKGGEQERGLRGGTLNTAGIVGFAAALRRAQRDREMFCAHTEKLRNFFEAEILSALGEEAVTDGENRVPNLSHITFRKGGEAFLNVLDLHGIACSGGAACSAHAALPSHVLLAMGRSGDQAKRGVRFSFGKDTMEEETVFAARTVIGCYRAL